MADSPITHHSSLITVTRAFVYAAGYGTRLRPYTLTTPKPMLDLFGHPIIAYVLAALARAGLTHATVNVAWLAEAFAGLPAIGRKLGLDVALSVQELPLRHGGDLAFASGFFAGLRPDEVFLAVNGDTILELDAAGLGRAAGLVVESEPVHLLGQRASAGALRVGAHGRLVGIGEIDYVAHAGPEERWDDVGVKLFHAGVRGVLPAPGTTMDLHGPNGLVGRVVASGRTVRVGPAPVTARAEIGTVAEYEARGVNAELRALCRRVMGG